MGIEEQILEMKYQEGYRIGLLKAETEQNTLFVTNLLQQTNFIDEHIAVLVNVTLAFVKAVKANLSAQSKNSCS